MTKALLIGSANQDKVQELRDLLKDLPWPVKSLSDFPPILAPEEDAPTLEGNALIKARFYSRAYEMPCVADDTGLEVDALNGAPGVYAARYAGDDATYEDNVNMLLDAMKDVPQEDRTARFVCCAAFADPSGKSHTELGSIEGRIALESMGESGFGYDPVFIPTGYDRTFSELGLEEKQRISHRKQAFEQMRNCLPSLLRHRP